jgi:hypothetical protein
MRRKALAARLACLLAAAAIVACGPALPEPAGPPAAGPPAPAASAPPAPSEPLPTHTFRAQLDDDFVRPLAERPPTRELDPGLVSLLPPRARKPTTDALASLVPPAIGEAPPRPKPAAPTAARPGKGAGSRANPRLDAALVALRAEASRRGAPPATWLFRGYLAEQLAAELALSPEAAGASAEVSALLDEAQQAYERAQSSPADSAIGKEARYRLGVFLMSYSRGDRGLAIARELVALGDPSPDTLYRLGWLLSTGPQGDPRQAAEAFTRGLESKAPAPAGLRVGMMHGLMLATYRQLRFDEALRVSVRVLGALPPYEAPTTLTDGALRVAADSVERLGGLPGVGRLADAPRPPPEALMRLAWRAVRRRDLAEAASLAGLVLERAPLDWRAPQAQKALVAIADRSGDAALTDSLRKQLVERFGPQSSWAAEQRRRRDPQGRPSDQSIGDASKPPAAPRHEAPGAEVEGRVRALVRLCLEPDWWRVPPAARLGEEGVVIAVSASVVPGQSPVVKASVASGGVPLEQTLACLQQLGPSHLAGAPASVSARIKY